MTLSAILMSGGSRGGVQRQRNNGSSSSTLLKIFGPIRILMRSIKTIGMPITEVLPLKKFLKTWCWEIAGMKWNCINFWQMIPPLNLRCGKA